MYNIKNFSYREIQQYAYKAVTHLNATRPNDRKKVSLWPLAKQYLESSFHTPTHDDSAPHNGQTIVPIASDREVVTTSTINDVNATANTADWNRKAKSFICHKQAELDRRMFGTDEFHSRMLDCIDPTSPVDPTHFAVGKRYRSKADALRAVHEFAEKNELSISISDNTFYFKARCSCYIPGNKTGARAQGMFVSISANIPPEAIEKTVEMLKLKEQEEHDPVNAQFEEEQLEAERVAVAGQQCDSVDEENSETGTSSDDTSYDASDDTSAADLLTNLEWEITEVGECQKSCTGRNCNINHNNTCDNNSNRRERRGGPRKSTTQIPLIYRARILSKAVTVNEMVKLTHKQAKDILQPYIARLTYSLLTSSIARAKDVLLGVPDENVKLIASFVNQLNQKGHFAAVYFMTKAEYKEYFLNQAKAKHDRKRRKTLVHKQLMKVKKEKRNLQKKRVKNTSQPLLKAALEQTKDKISELESKLPKFSEQDPSVKDILDLIETYPDGASFLKSWIFVPSFAADYIQNEGHCSEDTQTRIFEADAAHSKEENAEGTFLNIIAKASLDVMCVICCVCAA